ncbi:MAG: DHH family phosphoesterase [Planctomycetota bacterium]
MPRLSHFASPPAALITALRRARRPLLLTHLQPDGDALGSELGLARALRALGAAPRLLITDPAPQTLEFLDRDRSIEVYDPSRGAETARRFADADLIVVVDTSESKRLGSLREFALKSAAPRWVIDHHVAGDLIDSAESWSVPTSPATGLLVLQVVEQLLAGWTTATHGAVLETIAEPLFVAIASDTGWFSNSATDALAFDGVARLVEWGAAPEALRKRLFQSFSINRMRLEGEVLAGLRQAAAGRILYAVVTEADRARHDIALVDLDGIVDALRAVAGAEILILFVELSSGNYKVSIRSAGARPVFGLAAQFGGGGHANAAGCRLVGGESDVIARMLAAAERTI